MQKFIKQLFKSGENVIESESFRSLYFVVKEGHLVIASARNGMFSIKMDCVNDFVNEIKEVVEVWKNV